MAFCQSPKISLWITSKLNVLPAPMAMQQPLIVCSPGGRNSQELNFPVDAALDVWCDIGTIWDPYRNCSRAWKPKDGQKTCTSPPPPILHLEYRTLNHPELIKAAKYQQICLNLKAQATKADYFKLSVILFGDFLNLRKHFLTQETNLPKYDMFRQQDTLDTI